MTICTPNLALFNLQFNRFYWVAERNKLRNFCFLGSADVVKLKYQYIITTAVNTRRTRQEGKYEFTRFVSLFFFPFLHPFLASLLISVVKRSISLAIALFAVALQAVRCCALFVKFSFALCEQTPIALFH